MNSCVYYCTVWGTVGFRGDGFGRVESGGVGVGDGVVGCYGGVGVVVAYVPVMERVDGESGCGVGWWDLLAGGQLDLTSLFKLFC